MSAAPPYDYGYFAKKPARSDAYRRWAGLIFGAILGATIGGVSQWINPLALPGIPYYQPPFGPLVNMLLCVLIGACLGLITAWAESSIIGVIAAGAAGSLFVMVILYLTSLNDPTFPVARIVVLFFLSLPAFGALVPLLAIFRWALGREEEEHAQRSFTLLRVLVPVAIVLLLGGLGATRLYGPEARSLLARTQGIVQSGLAAGDSSSLPPALREMDGPAFGQYATPVYTLEWTRSELSRFAIPHPLSTEADTSVVLARFDNGYSMACMYVPGEAEPRCKGYELAGNP